MWRRQLCPSLNFSWLPLLLTNKQTSESNYLCCLVKFIPENCVVNLCMDYMYNLEFTGSHTSTEFKLLKKLFSKVWALQKWAIITISSIVSCTGKWPYSVLYFPNCLFLFYLQIWHYKHILYHISIYYVQPWLFLTAFNYSFERMAIQSWNRPSKSIFSLECSGYVTVSNVKILSKTTY